MRGQAQTGQFSAPTVQTAQLATPPLQLQQPDAIEKPLSGELNSHLPSWLHFSGEIKLQCGILGDFFRNTDDSYLLTRLGLNMAIKPTSWLKFYLQGEMHTLSARARRTCCRAFSKTRWIYGSPMWIWETSRRRNSGCAWTDRIWLSAKNVLSAPQTG